MWSSYSYSEYATPPDGALILFGPLYPNYAILVVDQYNVKSPSVLLSRSLLLGYRYFLPPGLTKGLSAFFQLALYRVLYFTSRIILNLQRLSAHFQHSEATHAIQSRLFTPLITNFTNFMNIQLINTLIRLRSLVSARSR